MDSRYYEGQPCEHRIQEAQAHPEGDFFGGIQGLCQDCGTTISLYNDVYHAMAGNVYAMARLAEAGLIPGSRPTLLDLEMAGRSLFARMSPRTRAISEAEAKSELDTI